MIGGGSRNIFPFALAALFGIMNGVYIFKPIVIDGRIQKLQEEYLSLPPSLSIPSEDRIWGIVNELTGL